jgi:hypothetical protein
MTHAVPLQELRALEALAADLEQRADNMQVILQSLADAYVDTDVGRCFKGMAQQLLEPVLDESHDLWERLFDLLPRTTVTDESP